MSEREIKMQIIDKADIIAKALKNGDCEIRKGSTGISVAEVKRKVIK